MKDFNETLNEMFAEAQAKLPPEDRCACWSGVEMCKDPYDGYKCTKATGHKGKHMAHGRLGEVIKIWEVNATTKTQ